jgi:hypothetical protein
MPQGTRFVVMGTVTTASQRAVVGAHVLVRGLFHEREINLAEGQTDERGRYEIVATAPDVRGFRIESLWIEVLTVEGIEGRSEPTAARPERVLIDLQLDIDNDVPTADRRVHGEVRDALGELQRDVVVEAFDRDLRAEEPLGRVRAPDGHYEIWYSAAQFRRAEKEYADLVVTVTDAAGSVLARSAVVYNAPADARIDVAAGRAPFAGPSTWEVMNGTLLPLLDGLQPVDLREDDEHQDLSFLAGETGYTPLELGVWVASWRLAERTARDEDLLSEGEPLPPEAVFAFLRTGQPSLFRPGMLEDVKHLERQLLMEDTLLRGLAALPPDRQRQIVAEAVDANLVPARVGANVDTLVTSLERIRLRLARDQSVGGGKGTIGQLLGAIDVGRDAQATVVAALEEHRGPLRSLWKKLDAEGSLEREIIERVRTGVELGSLTRNHVPLVAALTPRLLSGELTKRQLAQFSSDDWQALFRSEDPGGTVIGVPDNVDGATEAEKAATYATILEKQFERAYPTAALAGRILRARDAAPELAPNVAEFLNANPDFQLDRTRVDHYFDEKAIARGDGALVQQLSKIQRVFTLSSKFDSANALLSLGLTSAQHVYFLGQGQLKSMLADTPVNAVEARAIYRKAESVYAHALALFGEFNVTINGPIPSGMPQPMTKLGADTQAKIASLPTLRSLFGTLDYCDCSQCQSVYSPAAHFVDVLRFLGDRSTQGTGINTGKTVADVLLDRRPDLGDIELSCANTNTTIPYLDLVNEILEDVVAPPRQIALPTAVIALLAEGRATPALRAELLSLGVELGEEAYVYTADSRGHMRIRDDSASFRIVPSGAGSALVPSRQTGITAAEARSGPEHVNAAAYAKLAGEVYPFALPFDLPFENAKIYLRRLGVPLEKTLALFGAGAPVIERTCAELGIDATTRQVLTDTLAGRQPWDYWGLAQTGNALPHPDAPTDPTAVVSGTWLEVLARVAIMLHRTGLTYRQFLAVRDSRFVNGAGAIVILPPHGADALPCDVSAMAITDLDAPTAGRLHRFVRLWQRVGLSIAELDQFLAGRSLDDDGLTDLSVLLRLRERTSLPFADLVALFAGLDDHAYPDHESGQGAIIASVYERVFRARPVLTAAAFPRKLAQVAGSVDDWVLGLVAALRVGEVELDLILASAGAMRGDPLTAELLGRLWRVPVLARALGLSIRQFLDIARITGIDAFSSPSSALTFAALTDEILASPFTVAELDYLLSHRFTPNSSVALESKAISGFLSALRTGLVEVAKAVRRQSGEADSAYVASRLGQLPTLRSDADLAAAQALVDGSWAGTHADRTALLESGFSGLLTDLAQAQIELGELPSGETPAQRQERVDARFAYVAPRLEAFLVRAALEGHLRQQLAAFLGLAGPSSDLVAEGVSVGGTSLLDLLLDPALIATASDGTFISGVDAAALPDVHEAVVLAHKAALLISGFALTPAEVSWWLEGTNAAGLGWIAAGDLTTDPTAPLDYAGWSAMRWTFAWRKDLPVSGLTIPEFFDELLNPASPSSESIAALSRLTAWSADDIVALATQFGWLGGAQDTAKAELAQASQLERIAEGAAALRLLGVKAERAATWATHRPTAIVADEVKRALKARYDEKQWLDVNQTIQDVLRERRRDVLVDWLVTHPDAAAGQTWTDAAGLYAYYLIDVETNAVVLTSRLKQATASVALFAQRVLLGLEVDILASTVADPKWKQWGWMRRYRVWEANRKVFLYPENWIEPELRDEKSAFFQELESFLRQQDVTPQYAEEAYRDYLTKLEKVANLEIRAMYEERIGEESILHVVARTRSSKGAEYFYRTRVNRARWTAWQPLSLEISADHLVIGMHNKRLYLLWPQFLEKADDPNTLRTPAENSMFTVESPRKYWELRLFWSELRGSKWTPKVLSDSHLRIPFLYSGGDPQNVAFRVRLAPQIRARVFMTPDPKTSAPISEEAFEKLGPQVSSYRDGYVEYLIVPPGAYSYGNLIRQRTNALHFYYSSIVESSKAHQLSPTEGAATIRLLRNMPGGGRTVIDSVAAGFAPQGGFFVWDDRRSYFVDYLHRTETKYVSQRLHTRVVSQFAFDPHYHPFAELFTKELNTWGLPGLLNRRIQVAPETIPGAPARFDFSAYQPDSRVVAPYPVEQVDFTYAGSYSPYNWELFFHVPMYIAGRLAANQRFEEALAYYSYVFDPTSTDTATPDPDTPQQKFWITKPFYETTKADYHQERIESIMNAIARGDAELRAQVAQWRQHPFNPHLIARMRTVAYQKNVLIKYLETLIAWGDQLFAQDTIESINEATQLYMLADSVLGVRPRSVPRTTPTPVRTFYQLKSEGIDDFGNVLVEIENLLPQASAPDAPIPPGPELPRLELRYFGIPNNDNLLRLWDTVDDRLFKIRNSLNLAGVFRQLPLFEPPIDPALLVKAASSGLDIGAILSELSGPLPAYRFTVMIEKARAASDAVSALGAAILAALEKRDAESFAALRSTHEQAAMDVLRDVRLSEIGDATATLEAVQLSKALVELRRAHYRKLDNDGWNAGEITAMTLSGVSLALEAAVAVGYVLSGGLKLIPDFVAGAAGFGGTPHVTAKMGGQSIGNSAEMAVATLRSIATAADKGAAMASVAAGYARRSDDWQHQEKLAATELPVVDKQIRSAEIRQQIAEQNLRYHDKQRDNAAEQDEFLHSKFTNDELYDWMLGQLTTAYFQSYQLAFDLAKRAERCFRYELGIENSGYIGFGYWDSLHKGLLAGEKLGLDLRRLDAAYHDLNRREYEITKHFALSQLDPVALLQLKRNGECFFDIPEVAFDLDNPGHYFRRIKTVSLSVPSVVGPYGSVSCTLTLVANSLRTVPTLLGGKYPRDTMNPDPRFRDGVTSIQSIATSTAVDDAGLFQLRFDDERYLPFEGAGAISSWHLRLNPAVAQFDHDSISDVVVGVQYTAREGGGLLRQEASKDIGEALSTAVLAADRAGLYRVIDLKRELPTEFYRFLHPANSADEQVLTIENLAERLPYFTRAFPTKKVRAVEVVAKFGNDAVYELLLQPLDDPLTLAPDTTYAGLHRASKDLAGSEASFTGWSLKVRKQGATDFSSLPPEAITELFLILNYTVAST